MQALALLLLSVALFSGLSTGVGVAWVVLRIDERQGVYQGDWRENLRGVCNNSGYNRTHSDWDCWTFAEISDIIYADSDILMNALGPFSQIRSLRFGPNQATVQSFSKSFLRVTGLEIANMLLK